MKLLHFLPCVMAGALLTGCSDNIDMVKGGTLNGYESLTVGEALDKSNVCVPQSQKWEKFETSNGMEIVQFTCQSSEFIEISERLVRKYANDETPTGEERLNDVDLDDAIFTFQFSIAKDGEHFKLERSGCELVWHDGKKYFEPNGDLYDKFYNNETLFDDILKLPDQMQTVAYQQLDAQMEVLFTLMKPKAK